MTAIRFPTALLAAACFAAAMQTAMGEGRLFDFREPPHSYFDHEPGDRWARLKPKLIAGEVSLDQTSDMAFLKSMLAALEVPESSQMLVFSATSLQSEKIRPRNPRALYFNEDTYVGYVPGGVLEIAAIDPEMGPMFYVFERPTVGRVPEPERSRRCFNCHAGSATRYVPGLIAESVLVSMAGSSLRTFRHDEQGHQLPLEDRFGGWLLTGDSGLSQHRGNLVGESQVGRVREFAVRAGELYDPAIHPRPTSDILPQLLHEHQLGFENRLFQLRYLLRQRLHEGGGRLTAEAEKEIDAEARAFARYSLFADEAALPRGGLRVDADYARDFQARAAGGTEAERTLRTLNLKDRLFEYRCSYMFCTESWTATPRELKERVYRHMASGLRESGTPPDLSHLPVAERLAIRRLVKQALPDLPAWWR